MENVFYLVMAAIKLTNSTLKEAVKIIKEKPFPWAFAQGNGF
ncbi:hypothetical protein ACFO25_19910 [Paenactinomyces guangxiensis]|nr:hypothetical protein [Paenactinomyces guangxiensis]